MDTVPRGKNSDGLGSRAGPCGWGATDTVEYTMTGGTTHERADGGGGVTGLSGCYVGKASFQGEDMRMYPFFGTAVAPAGEPAD